MSLYLEKEGEKNVDSLRFDSLPSYIKGLLDPRSSNSKEDDTRLRVSVPSLDEITLLSSSQSRYSALLLQRHLLTEKIAEHGKCNPDLILQRAEIYEALEYPDLAVSDAYVVYMLCLQALSDEWVIDLEASDSEGESWPPDDLVAAQYMLFSLSLLCRCLKELGATKAANLKRSLLIEHFAKVEPEKKPHEVVEIVDAAWLQPRGLLWSFKSKHKAFSNLASESSTSRFGYSRREIYPWNNHEPNRNSTSSVAEINKLLKRVAPDLRAKVTALPALNESGSVDGFWHQLGLFANRDLKAGEELLNEKSILTAIRPLDDAICDACGADLESVTIEQRVACPGDDCDVTFCSEDCAERAKREYHQPAFEVEDEEDSDTPTEEQHVSTRAIFCGNHEANAIGRYETTETPEWDLYFLLLARTIAMAITQDIHPLDLPEVKYLWGDFTTAQSVPRADRADSEIPAKTLPFSITHNVSLPLDFFTTLSNAFDVPTATPYSAAWLEFFDPWILQTLLAKFRGVANATQSTYDGKAEIAAVHPMWCLANHSCNPNVSWSPTGTRVFTVREVPAWVKPGSKGKESKGKQVMIEKDTEILSHYTDPRLPLHERQERLREVLGGDCQCERCIFEAKQNHK